MGDVSFSASGFKTIWNYFETSHATGSRNDARANLTHKADMVVIKRQEVIQKWKIFSSLLKKSENASPFSLSVRKCTSKEKNFSM